MSISLVSRVVVFYANDVYMYIDVLICQWHCEQAVSVYTAQILMYVLLLPIDMM